MVFEQNHKVNANKITQTTQTSYKDNTAEDNPHNLGRIPFETFQEEEYLEEASRTPPIPVQMEQKLIYFRINVQSPSKSITIIPAIPALPAIPLSEVE